jgi:hypothetical protein
MSDDGSRVFFTSPVGLTPRALNLVAIQTNPTTYAQNTYEWEQAGVGSCPASQSSGCVYLISDGSDAAYFDGIQLVGTDATGANVFFKTFDSLVPQDTDGGQLDIYDARICTSSDPCVKPPPSITTCSGAACQGTPGAPPAVSTAASVTFTGPGNATPGAPAAKATVLTRVVDGTTFFLKVRVPGRGRITVTGAGIKTVRRSVSKAGTYELRVMLIAKARRVLGREHKLELKLRVQYAPAGGPASAATVRLTVRPAVHRDRRAKKARRATSDLGGSK